MEKLYIYFIVCLINFPVVSQWSSNPNTNLQVSDVGVGSIVRPDVRGNTKVAFSIKSPFNFKYTGYFQKVDKFGYLKWNEPKLICDGPFPNSVPQAIYNGDEGTTLLCYVSGDSWIDSLGHWHSYSEPYIQKLDSNSNRLWGYYGIKFREDTSNSSLSRFEFCKDNEGNIFGAFYYQRRGSGSYKDSLYIQQISKDGERLWGDYGIFVDDSIFSALDLWIVNDKSGGVYIHYMKKNYEYYIHRYDSHGKLNWTVINEYSSHEVIKDGWGGIMISGVVGSYPANKIIINRISSEGEKLWGDEGIIVDDSVYNRYYEPALLCLNEDNTVSVFWHNGWYLQSEIFLQRYDLSGNPLWDSNQIESDTTSIKGARDIIRSENNSNLILFGDGRQPTGLYAQRIDKFGNRVWNDSDRAVSYIVAGIGNLITDGSGGGIAYYEISEIDLWGIYFQQISKNGNLGEVITSVNEDEDNNINPESFSLSQNYPNPFNPATTIKYQIPQTGFVTLKVYDILGKEIATLVNEEKSAGRYEVSFSARGGSASGGNASSLASGVYLYRINVNDFVDVKKMLLLK